MPKTRSPGYPAIGLKEAIERVRLIYEQDYQNELPKLVIAQHMGYKSLSGASLPIIAALDKFGLIEGRGDKTKVSDLALAIIAHQAGAPERIAALKEAAETPALFGELDEKFPGGKGSDAAIRAYLLTQKFIPEAADTAIRAYRETKQLVEAESRGYPSLEVPEPEEMQPLVASAKPRQMPPPAPPAATGTPGLDPTAPFQVVMMIDRVIATGTLRDQAQADLAIKMIEMAKALLPKPAPHAVRPILNDDDAAQDENN